MSRAHARQTRSAVLFLAPNLIGFLVFMAIPLVVSLAMAFTNWDLRRRVPLRFVGLGNFTDLLSSTEFWLYFLNTLYLMLAIPFSIAGSLLLALLLNRPLTAHHHFTSRLTHAAIVITTAIILGGFLISLDTFPARILAGFLLLAAVIYSLGLFTGVIAYRTIYYLPSFTSGVALFILWKALYNPQTGPINAALFWLLDGPWGGLNVMLSWFHIGPLSPPEWLQSIKNLFALNPERVAITPGLFGLGARDAIVLMSVATAVGGSNMLLYLAGLSNIPPELYEAADIDGASPWQRFWNVTWPQLAPTTFFITVMSLIGGLQGGFEQARIMTEGGPAGTTTTLAYYIYNKGFNEFRFGYASAVAWILFALVLVLTLIAWRFGNRGNAE